MSDRKYKQQGYQDSGHSGRGAGGKGRTPAPKKDGPRGRGLGKPSVSVSKCFRCGTKIEAFPAVDAQCSECGSDLHACTNCRHFDTSARFECRQPIEVKISAKSKRNECELFELKVVQEFAKDSRKPDDAKSAFDALFDF